jgi:hypothetical protein
VYRAVGLNYGGHAKETGATLPAEPIVFLKAPDTVVGAGDEMLIPRSSRKTDWEARQPHDHVRIWTVQAMTLHPAGVDSSPA